MANKISTIFDLDDRGFSSTLKGIGKSVGETDGILGKFKAGAKGTFDGLKQYAGEAALGAGAALVAFSVKAVGAFTDVAKAALDLSTSTGLAVEDASRWLGVADDFQVSAEAMATGLGKIAKTLDDTKWDKYGIATRDAGGNARDVNDILLDSFDMLSKVTNKTEQARIGQQLFGKGYQSLTPILGHTRAEYEKMLGAVEKGQVITEKEAAKAERMRLAQDQLSDSLKEITLSWGQVVSGMAPAVSQSAEAIATFLELAERADNLTEKLGGLKGVLDIIAGGNPVTVFNKMVDAFTTFTPNVEAVTEAMTETDRETRRLAQAFGEVEGATDEATAAADENKRHNESLERDVTAGLDRIKNKWKEVQGTLSDEEAWLSLQSEFDEVKAKFEEAAVVGDKSAGEIEQGLRDAATAMAGLRSDVIDYGVDVLGLPDEKMTRIFAAVNPESLAEAEALIANLTRNRDFSLGIISRGGAGYASLSGAQASGTTNAPRGLNLVGERGPELVNFGGGETVYNAGDTARMMGGGATIVVNVLGTVIQERDLARTVAAAIIDGQRRGAILPWAS